MNKVEYEKYLMSSEWQEKRLKRIAIDKRCRGCGTTNNLHVHHVYPDGYKNIPNESVEDDLTTLCKDCHIAIHDSIEALPRNMTKKKVKKKLKNRNRAVVLGETRNSDHIPELIILLHSDVANTRRLAASALGKIGNKRAVEPLITLLEQETKSQVRQYAIKALGKIGDKDAIYVLKEVISNSNEKSYNVKAARLALNNITKVDHHS